MKNFLVLLWWRVRRFVFGPTFCPRCYHEIGPGKSEDFPQFEFDFMCFGEEEEPS